VLRREQELLRIEVGEKSCHARRETVSFYRPKGIVYNSWCMDISTISSDKASLERLTSCFPWKAHMFVEARQCARFIMAAT
jgi:hypothetical protein